MRKRRNKICPTCHLPIPSVEVNIECSEHHIKCLRCGWPVAKNLIGKDGICYTCNSNMINSIKYEEEKDEKDVTDE